MTDEQIINRWKHERELAECVCSYFVDQVELSLVNETIDLITRQQAEIKGQKELISELIDVHNEHSETIAKLKTRIEGLKNGG